MTKSLPSKSLVLYADDDPDDIELVKESFKKYSESVELKSFKTGVELLDYIATLQALPCLIILDINMPSMSGKEVLQRLRSIEDYNNIPIILFSTSTLPSEKQFAKSFDAGFITKPLFGDQIYALVDHMLDHCSDNVKKNIRQGRL